MGSGRKSNVLHTGLTAHASPFAKDDGQSLYAEAWGPKSEKGNSIVDKECSGNCLAIVLRPSAKEATATFAVVKKSEDSMKTKPAVKKPENFNKNQMKSRRRGSGEAFDNFS
jgi:hypothetical protein